MEFVMIRHFAVFMLLVCVASISITQVARPPAEVPEETMRKLLIRRVDPVLQREPGMQIQGTVVLKAVIGKTGDIENLQMVSGHPMLVPAAIDAVKQWKYQPYEVNGIPVRVESTIRVEFVDRRRTEGDASVAAPEPSESPGAPLQIVNQMFEGHILRKVPPVYPPLARQARIQGTVALRVIINKLGDVRDVQLLSGHPMLAPAAIEAVKQWKYAPYELNGEAVEVETDVQVNFRLADDPPPQGPPENIVGGANGELISGVVASFPKPLEGERVSEAVMRLRRTQKVDPIYPGVAVPAHIHGTVVLDVRVNSLGDVEEVVRIGGPPTLAPTAIAAVKQWKYIPYMRDGGPISVVTTVQLNFSLEANESGGIVVEPPASEDSSPPRIPLPRRIRVSSGVSQGLLEKKVAPEYPPDARDARIQGTVVLRAVIDKEGNVFTLELVSGHPALAPAAMEAVRQWKYQPYLLNGQAIEVDTTIQVNFMLSNDPER
jgi:TonB family protein